MPWYLYRVCIPNLPADACPTIELCHGYNEHQATDPESGYPLERIYTAPNLSRGHSESRTKKMLTDQNIAKHGFTKYMRNDHGHYVKTAGSDGPSEFKVK